MIDKYDALKRASKEDLLAAYILGMRRLEALTDEQERFLCQGFKIASERGWEEVAPAWLDALERLTT